MQRYDDETRNVYAYTLITLMSDACWYRAKVIVYSIVRQRFFFRIHFRSSQ